MQDETTQPTVSPETTSPSTKKLSTAQAIIFGAVIIGIALIIAFGNAPQTEKAPKDSFTLGSDTTEEAPTLTFSPDDEGEHIRGNRNADVFLIEYSDIDCPFCKRFHPTMTEIMAFYGTEVAWVYRHFPLESIHPDAFVKAKATECVAEIAGNDAFWTFLDTLITTETTPAQLSALANAQGVDQSAFDTCMASTDIEAKVREDMESGIKAGVRGTPFTAVINVKTKEQATMPGAIGFEDAKGIIEPILN